MNPTLEDRVNLYCHTVQLRSIPDEELERLSKELKWGTYGPSSMEPLKWKGLYDCDTEHLENILITQHHVPSLYRVIILYLLRNRYKDKQTPSQF